MGTEAIFYTVCAAAALIMIIYYARRRRKLSSALFGGSTGLAALLLMNLFGGAVGVYLPLNLFNVCGSVILGAPFVAGLVIIRYL